MSARSLLRRPTRFSGRTAWRGRRRQAGSSASDARRNGEANEAGCEAHSGPDWKVSSWRPTRCEVCQGMGGRRPLAWQRNPAMATGSGGAFRPEEGPAGSFGGRQRFVNPGWRFCDLGFRAAGLGGVPLRSRRRAVRSAPWEARAARRRGRFSGRGRARSRRARPRDLGRPDASLDAILALQSEKPRRAARPRRPAGRELARISTQSQGGDSDGRYRARRHGPPSASASPKGSEAQRRSAARTTSSARSKLAREVDDRQLGARGAGR